MEFTIWNGMGGNQSSFIMQMSFEVYEGYEGSNKYEG